MRLAEEEREKLRLEEEGEEHERAVRDFERTQAGLEGARKKGPSVTETSEAKKKEEQPPQNGDSMALVVGAKRKFALDADELSRIAQEDRAKARKAIDSEKVCPDDLRIQDLQVRLANIAQRPRNRPYHLSGRLL